MNTSRPSVSYKWKGHVVAPDTFYKEAITKALKRYDFREVDRLKRERDKDVNLRLATMLRESDYYH